MPEVVIDGVRYIPDREAATRISCWYMFEFHAFARLKSTTIDGIIADADEIRRGPKGSCGSLCPIIVLSGDRELRRVGCAVHDGGKFDPARWDAMLPEWRIAVEADRDVMRLLPFNK